MHLKTDIASLSAATGPRCAVTVSKIQQYPYSQARWFDFWAAAVEIYTLCIQKGTPALFLEWVSVEPVGIQTNSHYLQTRSHLGDWLMRAGDNKQLYVNMTAEGGPLTLSNGCRSSGLCSQNTTFLAFD